MYIFSHLKLPNFQVLLTCVTVIRTKHTKHTLKYPFSHLSDPSNFSDSEQLSCSAFTAFYKQKHYRSYILNNNSETHLQIAHEVFVFLDGEDEVALDSIFLFRSETSIPRAESCFFSSAFSARASAFCSMNKATMPSNFLIDVKAWIRIAHRLCAVMAAIRFEIPITTNIAKKLMAN